MNKFSTLYKVTSCRYEADCRFSDLRNFQKKQKYIIIEEDTAYINERTSHTYYKKLDSWKVEITQVLNDIWKDESQRREKNNVPKIPIWKISTKINIEGHIKATEDPYLHSNVLPSVKTDFLNLLKMYKNQKNFEDYSKMLTLEINKQIANNFWQYQKEVDIAAKTKSLGRFKVYAQRKKKEKKRQQNVDKLELGFESDGSLEDDVNDFNGMGVEDSEENDDNDNNID